MSPLPIALRVTQLRGFRRTSTLHLRPLTLLYGPNNVGKSAISRSLLLLSDSVSPADVPLVLTGPAGRRTRFADLLWAGARDSNEPARLGLELVWPAGVPLQIAYFSFVKGDDGSTPLLRDVALFHEPIQPWTARWFDYGTRSRDSWSGRYSTCAGSGPAEESLLTFSGLVPVDPSIPPLAALADQLQPLAQARWLTTPRSLFGASRLVEEPTGGAPQPGPEGGVAVLQQLSQDPGLCAQVSRWFGDPAPGATEGAARELRFEPATDGYFRPTLTVPNVDGLRIHLADAGAGWNQVIPVLTLLAEAMRANGPRILVLEEPEAGLHPNAQRHLARAIVEVITARPDVRIVVETHSYPLLQLVQLAVLEKRLSPSQVGAHWVYQTDRAESRIELSEMGDNARLDSAWPVDAFVESLQLARELDRLRRPS